jgi:hypothetical protein
MRPALTTTALLLATGSWLWPWLAVTPAAASGGLHCGADDAAVAFSVQGGLTRGTGALFNFRGEIKLRLAGAPDDFRALTLDSSDLIQRWLDDKELKLHIYHERREGPYGAVTLLVETRADPDDEGNYHGNYVLTVSSTLSDRDVEATQVEARGAATCSAE